MENHRNNIQNKKAVTTDFRLTLKIDLLRGNVTINYNIVYFWHCDKRVSYIMCVALKTSDSTSRFEYIFFAMILRFD